MSINEAFHLPPPPQPLSLPSLAHPLSRLLDLRPCRRIESDMRVWIRWVEFSDTKRGKDGFLFRGVDRSFGVEGLLMPSCGKTRIFFMSPNSSMESYWNWEIRCFLLWRIRRSIAGVFLSCPGWFHLWLLLAYPAHRILHPSP